MEVGADNGRLEDIALPDFRLDNDFDCEMGMSVDGECWRDRGLQREDDYEDYYGFDEGRTDLPRRYLCNQIDR